MISILLIFENPDYLSLNHIKADYVKEKLIKIKQTKNYYN